MVSILKVLRKLEPALRQLYPSEPIVQVPFMLTLHETGGRLFSAFFRYTHCSVPVCYPHEITTGSQESFLLELFERPKTAL